MNTYQALLSRAPDSLRERMNLLADIPQREDYHPEGDVAIHQEIVTNRLAKTGDMNLVMAGVFHDIGKDETTFFKEKNGISYPTAPGHENVSANLVRNPVYSEWIEDEGADVSTVWEIVKYHMRIKQYISGQLKKPVKRERMEKLTSFKYLLAFSEADSMTKLVDGERKPFLHIDNFQFKTL